jgi:hypothetical protein
MRRALIWLAFVCWLATTLPVGAATGRIIKVLPQFLDLEGRNSLSPSLYDRDAYQAILRRHPERRSGRQFNVEWKAKGPAWGPLKLRVELQGTAAGDLPQQLVMEKPVQRGGWFSRWSVVKLTGEDYKKLGEVTAWRVTLWEGETLLGEQKSFLWQPPYSGQSASGPAPGL